MNTHLSNTSGKPLDIAIGGETHLDLILNDLLQEMPTEPELLGSGSSLALGGFSSNLAHNLWVLGARVGSTSQVGRDEMDGIGIARLAEAGIDTSDIARKPGSATGVNILGPRSRTQHPHLPRRPGRDVRGQPRPHLPHLRPPLPSLLCFPPDRPTPRPSQALRSPQASGAHPLARHQRRALRQLGQHPPYPLRHDRPAPTQRG